MYILIDMARYSSINYHLVWTPKFRKPLLTGDIAHELEQICYEIAKENNFQIKSLSIQPDHVHLFVSADSVIAPHMIVKRIKGRSSNVLRKKYDHLARLATLWSRSYYCGSVGHVSEDMVEMYIDTQGKKQC